jgi:hypothetical protein
VQAEATDEYGNKQFFNVFGIALIISIIFFGTTCIAGGCMRIFVSRDGAFVDPPSFAADGGGAADLESGTGKPKVDDSDSGRSCGTRVKATLDFIGKLGP